MTAQHTPGEWTAELGENAVPLTDGTFYLEPCWEVTAWAGADSCRLVADCGATGQPENEGNARLIAAAPDLLAALRPTADPPGPDVLDWLANRLVHVYRENPNTDFVVALRRMASDARAAIRKATQPPEAPCP